MSGGSITSGALAVAWKKLDFDAAGRATNFAETVGAPLRAFCKQGVDVSAGLEGLVSLMDDISDRVAKRYRESLVGDATLQDLPADDEGPRFVFYATSLQTGSSVRLSRPYIADYRIGRIPNPRLPLALAVASSSAFPPVLSPVVLKFDADAWEKLDGADLFPRRALREKLILTDGGVYDNMGLENVWDRFETVLVSDAGAPLGVEEDSSAIWHKQTLRVLDIVGEQSRALRKRELVANLEAGQMKGAYWGITTAIGDYGLDDALCRDTPVTESASRDPHATESVHRRGAGPPDQLGLRALRRGAAALSPRRVRPRRLARARAGALRPPCSPSRCCPRATATACGSSTARAATAIAS